MQTPKTGREIATSGDGRDITRGYLRGLQPTNDSIVRSRGHGDLRVYEEVMSDWQVKACWNQRQLAVVSREWHVDPGGERRIDKRAAEFLESQLRRIGWDRVTGLMLYGVYYGYAVAELIYGRDGQHVTLDRIAVRNRRRFRYNQDGELRLITPGNWTEGEPCRSPYFWHFSTGADNDDEPYGLGLAHWCYWPAYFKRNDIKFWLRFLEKFGSPTAHGTFDSQQHGEKDQGRLLEALQAIQQDSAVITPKDMEVALIEAARNGTGDYKQLHDTMDAAIAKVILGQTASSQGTPGRLGNDELQGDVRLDLIKADADLVCESFNLGPARWLTEWNFPGAELPRVFRQVEEPEDMAARAERDERVFRMAGFKPTRGYIQSTYDVELEEAAEPEPTPADGQPAASADDAAQFAEAGPAVTAADRLDDDLQPVTNAWIDQIRALVERANSLEEIRDGLVTLIPNMSLEQYAEAMAIANAATNLRGRADVEDEATQRARQ